MAEFDFESLSRLRVPELQEELSNRGLPTSGLKDELVKRLREALESEQIFGDVTEISEQEKKAESEKQRMEQERKSELDDKFMQLLSFMSEMKNKIEQGQEEINKNQEEMKNKIEQGQEEMKSEMNKRHEEMSKRQEEMSKRQEEMQTNIVNVINTKVDAIEEKVETLEKKNEEMFKCIEGKFETVDEKFGTIEGKIEKKIEGKFGEMEGKFGQIEEKFEKLEQEMKLKFNVELKKTLEDSQEFEVATGNKLEYAHHMPAVAKSSIKLSPYDGKASWQVYKTQFAIVAEANGWDSITRARQLAASLRAEAADVLRTIPENEQLNFETLSAALELRFGEKCLKDYSRLQLKTRMQKPNETLQELATDVERLSHLAFSDCPDDVRETLALQYFIDAVWDTEIQKALRMAELKDLKSALVYAIKVEIAQQSSQTECHYVRRVEEQQIKDVMLELLTKLLEELREMNQMLNTRETEFGRKKNARCWKCGAKGHFHRQCQSKGFQTMHPKQGVTTNKFGDKITARCWECGAEGHFRRQCRTRQDQRAKDMSKCKEPEKIFELRHQKGSLHYKQEEDLPESCRYCSAAEEEDKTARPVVRRVEVIVPDQPDPWSDKKVRDFQINDPDLKPIIDLMELSSTRPKWQDVSNLSPGAKHYWAIWDSLRIRNGVLHKMWESEDGITSKCQIVVPRSKIPDVLKELHCSPTGGHYGVIKTLQKVRERFYWNKVRDDVEEWCKYCGICGDRQRARNFGCIPDAPSSPEDYVPELQERLEDVHESTRSQINIPEKTKTRKTTRPRGRKFQEGDKVWFWNPIRRKGLSPKLQSSWEGPYTVLKRLNDVVVRIQKSTNSKPRVVHYDRLAPYYGNT